MPLAPTEAVYSPEERRGRSLFFWYTGMLGLAVFVYGVLDVITVFDPWIGWMEIFLGFGLFLNALLLPRHRNLVVAKAVFGTLLLAILAIIFPSGGQSGGAAFWVILFPIAMFATLGVRMALFFNAALFLVTLFFAWAARADVIASYYGLPVYQQLWVVMLVANVLGFAIERAQSRFRDTIVGERERMKVLLSNLPAGVIMVDSSGVPTQWNDSAGILLGKPMSFELRANRLAELFELKKKDGTGYDSSLLPLHVALDSGKSSTVSDVYVRRPAGTLSVLKFAGSPVRDTAGKLRGAVVVFEEIAEPKDLSG